MTVNFFFSSNHYSFKVSDKIHHLLQLHCWIHAFVIVINKFTGTINILAKTENSQSLSFIVITILIKPKVYII